MRLDTITDTETFTERVDLNGLRGLERFERLNNVGVRAGIIEGQSQDYPDGTSIVMVALANHDGTETIPSRPWLRLAFERNSDTMQAQMRLAAEHILTGRQGIGRAMALVGQQLLATQRQSLAQLTTPALAVSTIERKAYNRANGIKAKPPSQYHHPVDKPLIETGHLIQQHVVVVEGG